MLRRGASGGHSRDFCSHLVMYSKFVFQRFSWTPNQTIGSVDSILRIPCDHLHLETLLPDCLSSASNRESSTET